MKRLVFGLLMSLMLFTGCQTGSNPVAPDTSQNIPPPEPEPEYITMIIGTMNLEDGTISYKEIKVEKWER